METKTQTMSPKATTAQTLAVASPLVWDKVGERTYQTGVSNVALYLQDEGGTYPTGVAWSGVTAIKESPSGAEPTPLWADNIKYAIMMSAEEFGFSIEAYQSPVEFDKCDGQASLEQGVTLSAQPRSTFGLAYKTLIGNDTKGTDYGYELHLVYGALASPSENAHSTVNDSPEAQTMSWECTTTPVDVTGFKPTAHVVINSNTADPAKLTAFEKIIYGSEESAARLPLPNEVKTLMAPAA